LGSELSKVRSASISDLGELLKCYEDIWKSLREWLPESFVDPELERIRTPEGIDMFKRGIESKDEILLIAEENKEVAGLARGREVAGVCDLRFLGVKKEHRDKGIGTSLLKKLIEVAKERNAHKVWLLTSPRLLPAVKLYISNGFVPEGMLRKHSHGLDMIIYSKLLE
jgi:ribosomal protein S18 acetylase RimI-like enzyme